MDGTIRCSSKRPRRRRGYTPPDDRRDRQLLSGPPRPLPASPARIALARARVCYRHLAGRLGVAWLAALQRERLLRLQGGAFALSRCGIAWFESSGLTARRWPEGKPCLDWTERRDHLGGRLGALLTEHLFALGWIARRPDGRAVRVSQTGRRELERRLGLPAAHIVEA